MKIAVLGAGAWGTALAISLSSRVRTSLWARRPDFAAEMAKARENRAYLPGLTIPEGVQVTSDVDAALAGANLVIAATPTQAIKATFSLLRERSFPGLLWVCKGLVPGDGRLIHQVANELLSQPSGVLSGPSFAREVALGLPAALTLAASDADFAHEAAELVHGPRLRVYTSSDVIGVEVGGAVKNVLAIAAGISDGLGLGHNARAALITRGLAEITRLGLVLGGVPETFMGLAGIGDLILTATGDLSRNRQVGLRLAQGESLDEIILGLGHVAEGVGTTKEVHIRARELGVDMPITHAVYSVLFEHVHPRDAVESLMAREQKAEDSWGIHR